MSQQSGLVRPPEGPHTERVLREALARLDRVQHRAAAIADVPTGAAATAADNATAINKILAALRQAQIIKE
jgi:hypothetical protein